MTNPMLEQCAAALIAADARGVKQHFGQYIDPKDYNCMCALGVIGMNVFGFKWGSGVFNDSVFDTLEKHNISGVDIVMMNDTMKMPLKAIGEMMLSNPEKFRWK